MKILNKIKRLINPTTQTGSGVWTFIILAFLSLQLYLSVTPVYTSFSEKEYPYFEDKDMTKHFMNRNKENINKVASFNNFNEEDKGYKRLPLSKIIPFSCPGIKMSIEGKHLTFLKDDLLTNSKEDLFKKAEECFNLVLKDMDNRKLKAIEKDQKIEEAMLIKFKKENF